MYPTFKKRAAIHRPSSQLSACRCLLSMSLGEALESGAPVAFAALPTAVPAGKGSTRSRLWDRLQAGTPQTPRCVRPRQEELHPIKPGGARVPLHSPLPPPQDFHIRMHRPQQALRGPPTWHQKSLDPSTGAAGGWRGGDPRVSTCPAPGIRVRIKDTGRQSSSPGHTEPGAGTRIAATRSQRKRSFWTGTWQGRGLGVLTRPAEGCPLNVLCM